MTAHVVLGMHRSGTSLLTSILELAGCSLGPADRRGGSGRDNPRGFHENRDVVKLNEAALAATGGRWFNVLPIVEGGIDLVDRDVFGRRATEVLSWTSPDQPWAIKDPRMIPLFPLWREFLAQPTVVMPIRDPAEVAHSLHRREGMPLEVAAALWEFYVVRSLEDSRGLRRRLILHHRLLSDPVQTIRSLIDSLDDERLVVPSDEEIRGVVDTSLYRSRQSEIADAPFLQDSQRALFDLLEGCEDVDRLPTLAVSSGAAERLEMFRSQDKPTPLGSAASATNVRRTAVVVQGCRLPVFEASLRAIRETWAASTHEDVDVFFAYGNGCNDHELAPIESADGQPAPPVPDGAAIREGDLLLLGCSDLIEHQSHALLRKRLLSLRHLLETDSHDVFLLLCASSYVDLPALASHVATLDLELAFHGPTFVAENGRVLVSGSAMLLSRDVAQQLVDDTAELLTASNYRYADDVSISDWVATRISDTDAVEMAGRIRAQQPATTDNTFRQPAVPMPNYVEVPSEQQITVAGSYHYHFATDRPSDMRRFHQRYFEKTPAKPSCESTIFVQIASYRDRELPRTIANALERADEPGRLRFGICWQYDEETFDDLEPYIADDRFRIDEVYYRKSDGCTWARSRANGMFVGEDYYLQIDAHMRFAEGWDTTLIEMLEGIDAEKPVLTVYPPGYTTDGKGNDELKHWEALHVLALDKINEHLQTRQCTRIAADQNSPGKSPLIAAGFLFAHGSFCDEIPYDPFGYFAGEEIALAARAFSWGYDFFYPSEQLVWHRYDHDEPLHWSDKANSGSVSEDRSRERLSKLLVGDQRELAPYGLGPMRSIKSFEEYCGIDFAAAASGERLEEPTELQLSIDLDTSGIDLDDDYEVWVFAILGADGRELHREDIYDSDVLSGVSSNVTITASFEVSPRKYLLWPKARSSGFGQRRIRDIRSSVSVDT
jgi:hypothetical protein